MILVKTEAGQQVLRDRSVRLTPRQRSAFILCDGKRSVDEVLGGGMGIGREDIDQMIELGLLGPLDGAPPREPATAMAASPPVAVAMVESPALLKTATETVAVAPAPLFTTRSTQQRYQEAYPIATRLTGSLGLRGFRLNLSVEGTSTYEELLALAPKIRAAVGPEKAAELERALGH